jgi:hypothetical protein
VEAVQEKLMRENSRTLSLHFFDKAFQRTYRFSFGRSAFLHPGFDPAH